MTAYPSQLQRIPILIEDTFSDFESTLRGYERRAEGLAHKPVGKSSPRRAIIRYVALAS